jgi:phage recombination protein Bet
MATKNVPATGTDLELVAYKTRSGLEIRLSMDIVRQYLVTGRKDAVTVQELIYYMGICKARGLNPFAREVYLIKYSESDPAGIVTSIDFYRSRARAQEDCVGWESGVIVKKKNGELRYSKGLVLDDEELVGGWFKAQPRGWEQPMELEVNLKTFIKKTAQGVLTRFWKEENQPMMIAKVAESQGLRRVWPDEFRGTVTPEEIGELSDLLPTGDLIPSGLPGGAPIPEPPAVYDTTKFENLVKAKLDEIGDQARARVLLTHLEVYLNESAEKKSTKKEPWTPQMIMVGAAEFFEPYKISAKEAKERQINREQPGFWKRFLNWEADPARPWYVPPELAGDKGAGAEGPGPGEEEPPEETFEDRVDRVWEMAKAKYGTKIKDLKDNLGVVSINDITPENIDGLEEKLKK